MVIALTNESICLFHFSGFSLIYFFYIYFLPFIYIFYLNLLFEEVPSKSESHELISFCMQDSVCEVSILQHKNFIVWLEFPLYFEETNMQENIRARDLKKFRIYCSPVAALRLLNPFVFISCIYIWKMLHETHEQNFPFQWSPLCDIQRKSDGKIFHVRKIDYFAIPINISD